MLIDPADLKDINPDKIENDEEIEGENNGDDQNDNQNDGVNVEGQAAGYQNVVLISRIRHLLMKMWK